MKLRVRRQWSASDQSGAAPAPPAGPAPPPHSVPSVHAELDLNVCVCQHVAGVWEWTKTAAAARAPRQGGAATQRPPSGCGGGRTRRPGLCTRTKPDLRVRANTHEQQRSALKYKHDTQTCK